MSSYYEPNRNETELPAPSAKRERTMKFGLLGLLAMALFLVGTSLHLFDWLRGDPPHPTRFVPQGQQAQQINAQMSSLDDRTGTFTIQDVALGRAGAFKPMRTGNLGYNYPGKALWVRFEVDLGEYPDPHWYLLERWEHVGELTLFYPTGSTFRSISLSEAQPARARPFNVHQYLFQIPSSREPATYYMRYEPNGHTVTVSLTWAGMQGLIEHLSDAQLWLGLFFGGMVIMWLYNLMLFWYLRDRAYFYYIYYLGGFIVTFLYMNGFAPLFMRMGWWQERLFALCAYAAMHGVILFARHFLLLKENARLLDLTLRACQWIVVMAMALIFVLDRLNPYYIVNYLIFPVVPLLIAAGIVRWRQGYTPAKLYCLGWTVFAISLAVIGFKFVGLLPANFVTTYAIQVSSIWESVIFAFALAYRIKLTEAEAKEQSARFVQELEAAYQKEKEAVKEKTVFIAAVNHELRNPLQSLNVAVSMLNILEKSPEAEKFTGQAARAVAQITAQMRDIAVYSRLEAGVLTVRKVRFPLDELLNGVIHDFAQQAAEKQISLVLDNPGGAMQLVADHDRLRQVLDNLVSNAVKFTDRGSVILAQRTERDQAGKPRLCLSVTDTGPGIAEDDLPRLFKVFSQLDSGKKKLGSGLGLAIVKRIMSLLQGDIEVQSQIGSGTCIRVRIPLE